MQNFNLKFKIAELRILSMIILISELYFSNFLFESLIS